MFRVSTTAVALVVACGDAASDDANTRAIVAEDPTGASPDAAILSSQACTGNIPETEQHFVLIRDEEELVREYQKDLWQFGSASDPEIPKVDFQKFVVVAAYFGPGVCNGELRFSLTQGSAESILKVRLDSPCVIPALETWPFAFVKLPISSGGYRVEFERKTASCR